MVKLVYKHKWGGEPCSGTTFVPFEYNDKDEFIYDVIKRFDKKFFKEHPNAELFGELLGKNDIKNIENNVFTLEEWFIKEKQLTFAL